MKNKQFTVYYLLSLLGVFVFSFYPLNMGVTVVSDMIRFGTVYAENYPKYIIPYTPIALSVIVGVALIPVMLKWAKKHALAVGSAVSVGVFFAAELLLENTVMVTRTVTGVFTNLEAWQMAMCYVPTEMKTWTEVDILMGEYSPAFKIHFYVISVVLILSLLNCFYGFAKMIRFGDKSRLKPLILQSAASGMFLGMCIWACFTAFYRTGEIQVSTLSAVLMCVFFVLFGVTMGIYIASFTLNRRTLFSVTIPAVTASLITLIMYMGEMILLNGHIYRFGYGFFFREIPGIVLAPVDVVMILLSGIFTAAIAHGIRKKDNV